MHKLGGNMQTTDSKSKPQEKAREAFIRFLALMIQKYGKSKAIKK